MLERGQQELPEGSDHRCSGKDAAAKPNESLNTSVLEKLHVKGKLKSNYLLWISQQGFVLLVSSSWSYLLK